MVSRSQNDAGVANMTAAAIPARFSRSELPNMVTARSARNFGRLIHGLCTSFPKGTT